MIEQVLREKLLENTQGAKVHYYAAPDGAQLPMAVMELQHSEEDKPQGRKGGIKFSEFEVSCYGDNPEKAQALARELEYLLDGYKGLMGAEYITMARVVNQFDHDEPQSGSYARTFTLLINNRI